MFLRIKLTKKQIGRHDDDARRLRRRYCIVDIPRNTSTDGVFVYVCVFVLVFEVCLLCISRDMSACMYELAEAM